MKYSEEQLESLSEHIDLAEYIGQTEELHQRGENYFIRCPFHKGDDTPSLCIYTDTNRWYCYGCHRKGNIFNWIVQLEQISFPKAVEKVSQLVGIELTPHEESTSMTFFKEYNQISTTQGVHVDRPELDWQRDYVEKYKDELPEEWVKEGITDKAMREYNVRIDPVANRIVYPVFDSDNKFIGVKGRTRYPNYKALKLHKYINYTKIGTVDYFQGWQQALPYIITAKSVIIFEGVKSCMKAWAWNIRNTVAAETSKLSDGQLDLLIKNCICEVIIAFDSDQDFKSIATDDKIKSLKMLTQVSVIRDVKHLLGEKEAPVDQGEQVFRELLQKRYRL